MSLEAWTWRYVVPVAKEAGLTRKWQVFLPGGGQR